MTSWHVRYTTKVCQVCVIFTWHRRTKVSRSATLTAIVLRYPTAWRDFPVRNTMSTGKLKNMKFNVSHFWGEQRPTKNSEDRIATMFGPGGRFKNTYELLNVRALKISKLHKNHIFQCMGKIFCVEFQRVPLKFHTKYLTHTLKDVDFIHILKFKSSLI